MNKIISYTLLVRTVGIVLFGIIIWNLIWVINVFNPRAPLLSSIFIIGFGMTCFSYIISIMTNWGYKIPTARHLLDGQEPEVAVLIPTYGEPVDMVIRTIESVIDQDWPHDKLVIAVGDDGRNEDLNNAIIKLSSSTPVKIIYHTPYPKGHLLRMGEAKAGNLNSLLRFILKEFPDIEFIETRDADDLVGSKLFLKYCLGQLIDDRSISFVQTIKECQTSNGDPFSNMESVFYRQVMFSRHSSNAVFPCGSGLVWRLRELRRIGGFPHWNLVEDLQSGYEILLLGGKGCYLPIVGAVGQIAPEDIPNFYKQRGTWALDTLRLFFWKNPLFTNKLTVGQKLHFLELEYSYILSFAVFIYVIIISISLFFNIAPLVASKESYLSHTLTLIIAIEIFNYVRIRGISYKYLWRSRRIWIGLSPVFAISTIKALLFGPYKKPAYKVTRKSHMHSWYWQETITQYLIIIVLSSGIIYRMTKGNIDSIFGYESIAWALFFIYGYSQVVKNSWFMIFKSKLSIVPKI
ncbi:MAG TPA: glycosyltransferase family 2 protein [Candidatus Limnocylindrales bacterium]|nr:glycosyltransferase family 2 protein [Candidatus Limnocylindrales bacterium]